MRLFSPALLVLLTPVLTGLGVPAGFGQSSAVHANSGKIPGKKNAPSKGSSAKGHHPASPSSRKTPIKPSAKTPAKPSSKSPVRNATKTSKKSRRQPGQKTPTTDRISEIQEALTREGSYHGIASGKWDDDTAAAMRKFQSSHGLNPSGKLDAPTLQRLGLGSQTAGIAAPTPPPGATSRLTSSNNSPSGSADSQRRQ